MSEENNRYDWGGSDNGSRGTGDNGSSNYGGSENKGSADYVFESVLRENGKPKTKAFSVAAMILGIVSVVACCSGWASLLLGIGAVVFAILARKTLGYFDGMAIAGLILGIFGLVFGFFMIIGTYFFADWFGELVPEDLFEGEYEPPTPGGNTGEF